MKNSDPIQLQFESAIAHHQAGRLAEAEQLYRQVLTHRPTHFDAMQNLGVLAIQAGQYAPAADLLRRAVALNPHSPQANSNLGIALKNSGKMDDAVVALRRAVALNPGFAAAHSHLGDALVKKGQTDEAIVHYRRAITLDPNLAEAHYNFGCALEAKEQLNEAIAEYRCAIAVKPDYVEAFNNLGNALRETDDPDAAIAAFRRAIELNPQFAEAYSNLGVALGDRGLREEAIAALRRAIALKPDYHEARNNLGVVLKALREHDGAIAAFREAIALRDDYAEARCNLAAALEDARQLDQAEAEIRRAIDLKPDMAEAHALLASILSNQGLLEEGIRQYREAIALDPEIDSGGSNIAMALQYQRGDDNSALREELARWNRAHAEPLRKLIRPHSNDRSPDRPLRIGYVSPDFKAHVVGQFLLPLLEHHDRRKFEIFCYSNVAVPDESTHRFRALADHWHDIAPLSDEETAEQIRADGIDILVDLAAHTAHNRLLVFARRPAPVQVTYLAYCSTTGLESIDFRLTDPYFDPPDQTDQDYSEQSIRLPRTYWCYQPNLSVPEVAPLPALGAGHVTFGCLNNFCKISTAAIQTWCRILAIVPRSRLMLHCHEGSHRDRLRRMFSDEGIEPARVDMVGYMPTAQYFLAYHAIDIALDPFPFAGGSTTCDALWMGVPIVSLVGKTAVGRGGASILSNLKLTELLARTTEQYVEIARVLAGDLDRLQSLRRGMRHRMQSSPLMDAPQFALDVEAAYRQMWQIWCKS